MVSVLLCLLFSSFVFAGEFYYSTYPYYEALCDLDNDGVYEVFRDTDSNLSNGYDTYRDPNNNSILIRRVNFLDVTNDFLIDIDLDNRPDILACPSEGKLYQLLRRNVDRDPQLEYDVIGTSYFWDHVDRTFYRYCIVRGVVTNDKNVGIPGVKIDLYYEGSNVVIVSTVTDASGEYVIEVTTITEESYHVFRLFKHGYFSLIDKKWLEHKEYVINFVLYPTGLSGDQFIYYPNPVKEGGNLNICFNSTKEVKVSIDLLCIDGRYITRLYEDKLLPGQTELKFVLNYPRGFYYLLFHVDNSKKVYPLKIDKK